MIGPELRPAVSYLGNGVKLNFDPTFKLSDAASAVSLLISAMALLYTWGKDVDLKEKGQANEIRKAASDMLACLERRKDLSLWIFDDIQPLIVETSEHFSKDGNSIAARDMLWKGINAVKVNNKQHILEEKLESAYVNIYAFFPDTKSLLERTATLLKEKEDSMHDNLLIKTEFAILRFDEQIDPSRTAVIGNKLREITQGVRESYKTEVSKSLSGVEAVVFALIVRSDEDLVSRVGKYRLDSPR